MSDENENGEPTALDYMFNALGHLFKASAKSESERAEARNGKKKSRKIKTTAFDEAPAAPPSEPKSCCTAKR